MTLTSSPTVGEGASSSSDIIQRHEHPPVTDFEWATALKYYGSDRRLGHPDLDTCLGVPKSSPIPATGGLAAKRSQLLIHKENDDDEDDNDDSVHTPDADLPDTSDEPNSREGSWKRRAPTRSYGFGSWGGDVHVLSGTAADEPVEKVNNRPTSPEFTDRRKTSLFQEADSDGARDQSRQDRIDYLAFTQLTPDAPLGAFERQYEFVESVNLPRAVNPAEDRSPLCQESERVRLREAYESNGWLPAPNPSRDTRVRRSRAIRRLGLNDSDERKERWAVISKYLELAQLTFGTSSACATVIRGEQEDVYMAGMNEGCFSFPVASSLSGHVILNPEGRCFVIADLDKDWRLGKNPNRMANFANHRFLASAPLRYHRPSGDFIDFGTLTVIDDCPRDTFSNREQAILLRLANMAVYQLATLQSEIVAKRSSHMYESSINFLRRSLIPDHMKSGHEASEADKKQADAAAQAQSTPKSHERKKRRPKEVSRDIEVPRPPLTRKGRAAALGVPVDSPQSPAGSERSLALTPRQSASSDQPPAMRATKSGPRDSHRAKRKDLRAENAMFDDAANTLRGILRADGVCMVDLHEYQLYVRKSGTKHDPKATQTKETIVGDFLQGKEWPRNVEPIVKHVPRADNAFIEVMGQSGSSGTTFDFDKSDAIETVTCFLKEYLTNRHFWWDAEDPNDCLAQRVMCFMPAKTQTFLVSVFMTPNGTLRYATFVSWERPPANFDDSSRLALPFVWIIGAALVSALAVTRIRTVEESQITYSNLQAHELRTPLHQILAITQLLRSSMSDLAEGASLQTGTRMGCMNTLEQVRDLLPFLDAIDTSGKTLHGIVDNILTFLDLTASDHRWETSRAKHPIFGKRTVAPQTFGSMMEELVREAYDEHRRGRIGAGQAQGHIETVFEIIPKGLCDLVTEDHGGALRRAIARLISNAFRFIDGPGCVEIYVDDVKSMLPPEGYEGLSNNRRIAIHIIDNGRGMAQEFVDNKLGEPWAKEDLYATGSGLSVHLAFRIVDLMGGHMKISSAPGEGTVVSMEVPVPIRAGQGSPVLGSPALGPQRKVALLGFDRHGEDERCGLERLGASLERQYKTLGCDIVPVEEADLVIVDGGYEEEAESTFVLNTLPGSVVIFENDDDTVAPGTPATPAPTPPRVRRLRKPVTPALVRASLQEVPVPPLDSGPELDSMRRIVLRPRFENKPRAPTGPPGAGGPGAAPNWKAPRGVCVEDAVASLCLGDYFSSRSRPNRQSSVASSGTGTSQLTPPLDDGQPPSESPPTPYLGTTSASTSATTPSSVDLVPPPPMIEKIKVLVVEDNVINRKILVKILSTLVTIDGPSLDIVEAGDGLEAVEKFKAFDAPAIVLLDINMPKMDGYAAAVEMRLTEKRKRDMVQGENDTFSTFTCVKGYTTPHTRSKIFAITALAGEDEKRRGLVESGMDMWLTKPCPKATLQKVVEEARRELLLQYTK